MFSQVAFAGCAVIPITKCVFILCWIIGAPGCKCPLAATASPGGLEN